MGEDTIKVSLGDCTLGKVWDKKAAKDLPGQVDTALKKALKTAVDIVSKVPDDGFILSPSVDMDFDDKKGELFGKINVAIAWGDGRIIGTDVKKGGLTKVDADSLDKKLSALGSAYGKQMGESLPSTLADEKKKAAKKR